VRDRKPVYGEIGHTIMNLLADFRNYQYQLMCVRGLVVHMEEKRTYINLPRNRYNEVLDLCQLVQGHTGRLRIYGTLCTCMSVKTCIEGITFVML